MTVKELIAALQALPEYEQDLEVCITPLEPTPQPIIRLDDSGANFSHGPTKVLIQY